jgi:hypothetical protein
LFFSTGKFQLNQAISSSTWEISPASRSCSTTQLMNACFQLFKFFFKRCFTVQTLLKCAFFITPFLFNFFKFLLFFLDLFGDNG